MATTKEKVKAIRDEYWLLMGEINLIRDRIKAEWLTLDVLEMRELDHRLQEIDHRIASIKKLKSFVSEEMT